MKKLTSEELEILSEIRDAHPAHADIIEKLIDWHTPRERGRRVSNAAMVVWKLSKTPKSAAVLQIPGEPVRYRPTGERIAGCMRMAARRYGIKIATRLDEKTGKLTITRIE